MAQSTDMTLAPNISGTNQRTEINSIFSAILTGHSGASRPSYLTGNTGTWTKIVSATVHQLLYFDGADDILIGTLDLTSNSFAPAGQLGTFANAVDNKTANFTVASGDYGKLLTCDATAAGFVASFPTAAGLPAGWFVILQKTDATANAVTLDPFGSETINGFGTRPLSRQFDAAIVIKNGSNLQAVLLPNGIFLAPLDSPQLSGTPTAPTAVAGTNNTQIATTAFVQEAQTNRRNRLLNPRGAVWLAPLAGSYADDNYICDGFYVLTQTGAVAATRLTDPEAGYSDGVRITQSQATAQRFGYAQIIESKDCIDLRTKTVSFAPRVRVPTSTSLRYVILAHNGTKDVIDSDFVNNWTSTSYSPGNFFKSANLAVVASGQATPGGNIWTTLSRTGFNVPSDMTNLAVFCWTEAAVPQNFTLDFDDNILNLGTTLIPSSEPQRTLAEEIALCQRHAPTYLLPTVGTTQLGIGRATSGSNARFVLPLNIEPRVTPTGVTNSSPSAFSVVDNTGAGRTVTNISLLNATNQMATLSVDVGSGLTANTLCAFEASNAFIQLTGCRL